MSEKPYSPVSLPGKDTRFQKGLPRPPGAGRRKGTPNKVTRDIREATMLAVEQHGGLVEFISRHKRLLDALLVRMAPTKAENDQRITVRVTIGTAEPPALARKRPADPGWPRSTPQAGDTR